MVPASNLAADERLEQLIGRFEQAWRAGSRPSIEEYLTDQSVPRNVLLRELVDVDLEYRLRAATRCASRITCGAFPSWNGTSKS